ncbi:MAG: nitrous oxide reductase accessory protein NosL [Trueperaceae bacterium]
MPPVRPRNPEPVPDATFDPDRRRAIRRLGALAAGALVVASGATTVQAQMQHGHQHGGGPATGMAPASGATPPPAGTATGRPDAHAIPWAEGRCAFCDMTLATPPAAPQGAGFRERTYAQWAFGGEARHFESIGCALGWAYAHGVVDGEGAALYVAAYDQTEPPTHSELLAAAGATFLWAERLPASMMAKVGAFARQADAAAFVAPRSAQLGRRRYLDLTLLADLAPLPIANLVPLLQRQLG